MMFDAAVIDDALPANPVSSTSRLRGQKKDVQALSAEDLNAVRSAVDAWMTTFPGACRWSRLGFLG
jgi:hypothetical protein